MTSSPTVHTILFLLLTGVLAVVVIATLLLVGAEPHLVFTPGFLVRGGLEKLGVHAPNAVGVIATVLAFWIVILAVWLGISAVIRRRPA